MKKLLSLLVALVMIFACMNVWAVPARDGEDDDSELPESMIFFTNDVHCGIEDGWGYAGVAGARNLIDSITDEDGNKLVDTLLVDAGDAIQGGPIGTLSRGQYIIDIMNQAGYDLAIPGNHEFDYGMDRFLELAESAEFPYVSSNFMHYENGEPTERVFDAYKVFELGTKKVAFVGVTTPEAITKSTPTYFQDEEGNYIYGFCQDNSGDMLVEAIQDAIDEVAEEVDYVIVIGHLGIDEQSSPWMSTEVIPRLHGIDVFIDGHSHSVLNEVVENADGEEVLLVQTGTKLANLGMISIYEDGSLEATIQAADDEETLIIPDPATQELIDQINAEFEDLLNTVVAYTNFDLTVNDPVTGERLVRKAETNLGDLCADGYRTLLDADIAFVNGGGVRTNIPAGDITFQQIINVHPFGNEACLVEVSGQQILDALEMGSRAYPSENGGFLQVAGLKYEIHPDVEPNVTVGDDKMWLGPVDPELPYRVQNVQVMNKETGEYEALDLEKTYKLASHNYMLLNQGDGFAMFGRNNINVLLENVMIDNAVLINYIQSMPGDEEHEHIVIDDYADPLGQGRIVVVEEEAIPGDANGDGVVDTEDALIILRAAMGIEGDAEALLENCDVNEDGVIDTVDALLVLRMAMGIE
ncbi:MAG: 5'-nucleotidase C-terminal domain-containing protein [Clostridia bacterium]|nr:5'-nucleotidase C-terminal domain-containing protein [Clostridia bacterium]